VVPICLPQVGQKFRNSDDAWSYWINYGGHACFEVRKGLVGQVKLMKRLLHVDMCV
jgi:hypothetical protein